MAAVLKIQCEKINDYIQKEEVQKDYKGYIDINDREDFETKEEPKLDEIDEDKDLEEKFKKAKRENLQMKLRQFELEVELDKYARKEGVYKSKIAELDLNHDELLRQVSKLMHSSVVKSAITRTRSS